MNPKFIIVRGELILGFVNNHFQLNTTKASVDGGGWFKIDCDNNTCILYGESLDFGRADIELVEEAVNNCAVYFGGDNISHKYDFIYSTAKNQSSAETINECIVKRFKPPVINLLSYYFFDEVNVEEIKKDWDSGNFNEVSPYLTRFLKKIKEYESCDNEGQDNITEKIELKIL